MKSHQSNYLSENIRSESKEFSANSDLITCLQADAEKGVEMPSAEPLNNGERETRDNACFVICLGLEHDALQLSGKLSEILALLRNLGDQICGYAKYHVTQPNPKTLFGQGKLMTFADQARQAGASTLVIDAPLSPAQARNIETLTGLAVRDRAATILDVFARHARTKAARVQVEIAQLQYLKPRIRGIGLNMDQQSGGIGAGKGPGETASQLLVRQLDKRLGQLQKSAEKLKRIGATQRQGRTGCRQVALVGYTNAGKTSLMNALTQANLSARDAPFETLDTTTRVLTKQAGLEILLSDTVGFIRQLPESLLASFESTLAQACEADLILVVLDGSDPEWMLHFDTTLTVLKKLHLSDKPVHYVLNKVDMLTPEDQEEQCTKLKSLISEATFSSVSARDLEAVKRLKDAVIEKMTCKRKRSKVFVSHVAADALAMVYAQCNIVQMEANAVGTLFTVEAEAGTLNQLKRLLKKDTLTRS